MRARFLLLAAALVAFGASLGSGFHFDDYAIFSMSLPAALRQPGPLTDLTLWLNYQIAGEHAFVYHLVNLLLHLTAVVLAYEVLLHWIGPRPALIAAAIFAVHPLQSEAVTYISARGALLATVFLLAALYYLRPAAPPSGSPTSAAPHPPARWPAIPFLLLALLSVGGIPHSSHPAAYLLAQGLVIFRYLRLLIVPWGFTIDPDIPVPPPWLGIAAWLALIALAIVLWRARRPWTNWLLAALALLLLPSLFPSRDLAADYRAYPAVLAAAAAAGLLLANVQPRQVAAALVIVLGVISITRTYVWLSDERLWREAVRRAPDKTRPKLYLARSVRAAEALELLGRARSLDPHDPEIPAETGKILLQEGQPEAALTELTFAIGLDPRNALTLNNRGVALAELGQTEAARMDFEKALAIDPNFAEARENLTKVSPR